MNLFEVTAVLRSEIMFQGGLGNHLIQPSGSYASCPITYITQADSADAALSKVWRHITQDPQSSSYVNQCHSSFKHLLSSVI